jgi:hypothetical protein
MTIIHTRYAQCLAASLPSAGRRRVISEELNIGSDNRTVKRSSNILPKFNVIPHHRMYRDGDLNIDLENLQSCRNDRVRRHLSDVADSITSDSLVDRRCGAGRGQSTPDMLLPRRRAPSNSLPAA